MKSILTLFTIAVIGFKLLIILWCIFWKSGTPFFNLDGVDVEKTTAVEEDAETVVDSIFCKDFICSLRDTDKRDIVFF